MGGWMEGWMDGYNETVFMCVWVPLHLGNAFSQKCCSQDMKMTE